MELLAQMTQATPDPAAVAALLGSGVFLVVCLVIALVVIVFHVLIYFMIFQRTGMNPWLSLLMLVPIANLIMLIILAFTEWPIQREVRALRAQLSGGTIYPGTMAPPPPPGPPAVT
jgi:heme/copper-type cytochrome/quinol oxidase subunit 2